MLTVVAAAGLMLLAAWAVAAPLVSLGRSVHRSLAPHGFGMCTGLAAPGAPVALTDWLHTEIQRCAQLPPDQPLTFAMLQQEGISLQMVTTDLGMARPVTIPFSEEQYLFSPAELAELFPAAIVDHVLRAAGVPPAERDSTRTWFMPSQELPVVIGARLSSSVPILLSSLRLYSARAQATAPVESYMTDGGVTSNFPIHFFDNWLPDHPTFGLDLVAMAEAGTPEDQAPVFMPSEGDAARLPPSQSIRTVGSFLGHVQDASRNWRDELQAELPGFRDRVCQIRMRPGEGGFNLNADPATVRALVDRGRAAGQEILETFDWDRHRLTRYLTLMALLRENFALLGERWAAGPQATVTQDAQRQAEIDQTITDLIKRAATLPPPDDDAGSDPESSMRIGPRV